MSFLKLFFDNHAKGTKERKSFTVICFYLCCFHNFHETSAAVSFTARENFIDYLNSYTPRLDQDNVIDDASLQSSPHYHTKRYQKVRKKTLEDYEALPGNNIDSDSIATVNKNIPYYELTGTNDVGTLYLGYPKNPFGHSTRWHKKPRRVNDQGPHETNSTKLPFKIENNYNNLTEIREKRGVTHLYNMVSCATGCNPLSYKGYGCYCGFLGSGRITDSIDRCCMMHDICYATVNCPIFLVYFTPYLWKCWRGRPLCAIDHLGYGRAGSCAARLCECDRELAMCLTRSPCPHRRPLCTSSPLRLLQNIIML